jgi:hypothetical protein
MKRKKIDRDIIVLLISTLVTVASWVGFEVYRTYTQSKIDPSVEKYLQEFDPTLNTGLFSKLEERNR